MLLKNLKLSFSITDVFEKRKKEFTQRVHESEEKHSIEYICVGIYVYRWKKTTSNSLTTIYDLLKFSIDIMQVIKF